MYKKVDEAIALVSELSDLAVDVNGTEIVVCPPFTVLDAVTDVLQGSDIAVGAQNMYWQAEGAFTGEISPAMLRDIGCKYVILGHSERRQYFGETDGSVNKKITAAIAHGLTPIVCVGETLEQREAGTTEQIVRQQTEGALDGLAANEASGLVIAYEPVWAIGTGKTASTDDAQQVCGFIRRVVAEIFDRDVADKVRIQYGGSVKPDNISALMAQPDIDGALVGGASLEAKSFAGIVRF